MLLPPYSCGAGAAPWATICPRVATEPSSLGTPASSSLWLTRLGAVSPCWRHTWGSDSPLSSQVAAMVVSMYLYCYLDKK